MRMKKLAALLICFAFLFSLLPIAAHAAGSDPDALLIWKGDRKGVQWMDESGKSTGNFIGTISNTAAAKADKPKITSCIGEVKEFLQSEIFPLRAAKFPLSPQTCDNRKTMFWLGMCLASTLGLAWTVLKMRRT